MSNPQLELAFNFVENTGVNIFLTGRAGTGKTTFLRSLRKQSLKRMVVVAPTGVAAINAGGVTIHSFFQLPFGPFIPDSVRRESEVRRMNKIKIRIIRSMELLVIDEISMVRSDMLDAIDDVLRRYRDKTRPFGGVQLLMIGDLQQLSPVVKGEEWEILKEYYATPYFFDSIALKNSSYRNIELKQIYRQRDPQFIELLAKVRDGYLDSQALEALNNRYISNFNPEKKDGYITLTSHNHAAKRINDEKLIQLNTPKYKYIASISGDFPEFQYPIDYELILKKGAQVMFTRNDAVEKRYVNGTIGEIIAISDDSIEVKIDINSEIVTVEVAQWENIKYSINSDTKEITEDIIGTFTQFPLKTAWAITIHKSQGLTFDRVVIDAANSFSHGQVYVALSRCRTLEGVVLSTPIRSTSVRNDSTVQSFNSSVAQNPSTEHHLTEDKRKYYQDVLIELFDFSYLLMNLRYTRRQFEENLSNLYPKLLVKWNENIELFITDVHLIANRFQTQINNLMVNPEYEEDTVLSGRITSGATYFAEKCETLIAPLLATQTIEIDNKEVKKIITRAMERVVESYKLKKATLTSSTESFSIKTYLKAKAEIIATEEEKKKKSRATRTEQTKITKIIIDDSEIEDITNSGLFALLRAWRKEKASEMNKPVFFIAHQKVILAIAATEPTTAQELERINGVGKSFITKYGAEVLDIVAEYREENGATPTPTLF